MDLQRALVLVNQALEGTSQERLARTIGVDASVLSRWRRGKTVPEGEGREKIFTWAKAQSTPVNDVQGSAPNPLQAMHLRPHGHFRALHEKATAEQRKWLAQLMLDAIVANANDLREILEIEDTPAKSPEQIALEEKLATLPLPSAEDAALHRTASATVMRDAAAKQAKGKGSAGAHRKRA